MTTRGKPEIVLLNPNGYPEASARRLRPWLEALVGELAPAAGGLSVRFAGDRLLRRVNREFRRRDRPTDVLSFPGEDCVDGPYLGDVLISVPTARRQAARQGHSVERELRILLLHGLLHCLGHDHETDDGEMDRLEKRIRAQWLEAPVADRSAGRQPAGDHSAADHRGSAA
ncbi:MAG: rRNA maturation RNase YbeY [Acidobacteriota bacterium]